MSSWTRPSGFVRAVELADGVAFYAQVRTADGKRLQRRLGRAWMKRSRPPKGSLTRGQAELLLEEILAGRNPEVAIERKQEASNEAWVVARDRIDPELYPVGGVAQKAACLLHAPAQGRGVDD